MYAQAHQLGKTAALAEFGLVKTATDWRSILKQVAVGDPSRFMRDLKSGKPFGPGTMWREALWPESHLGKALTYGLPAYSLYQASQAPEGHRGAAIGSALGNVAGGILGAPLGMAGNLAANALTVPLGRTLGSALDGPARPHYRPAPRDMHIQPYPHGQALSDQMAEVTGRDPRL